MTRPLAVDLYCGLGGWTDGLLAEGWDVIGFDIERHRYGDHRYAGQLVVQDVMTLHGAQFRDAALIVASPPCQKYSYMAMPWSLAKAAAAVIRADTSGEKLEELNRLFNVCFQIQREACEAAGRHIPLIVENVRGAESWVGRARWNFGSFYLWGDVPALMPVTLRTVKVPGFRFDGSGKSFQTASVEHTDVKAPGMNWSDRSKRGQDFARIAGKHRQYTNDEMVGEQIPLVGATMPMPQLSRSDGFACRGLPQAPLDGRKGPTKIIHRRDGHPHTAHLTNPNEHIGIKPPSKSLGRKAASAMIAKIPLPLSRYIATTFRPDSAFAAAAE